MLQYKINDEATISRVSAFFPLTSLFLASLLSSQELQSFYCLFAKSCRERGLFE